MQLPSGAYSDQVKQWPAEGRHILAHFDADTSKHAHFICSGCDAIIDVRGVQNIDWRTMKDLVGCEVEDQTVVFTGRCAGCRQSTKEA